MSSVSVAEAKNHLSELIVRAEAGEVICVTRHGRPVAKLVAADPADDPSERRARVANAFSQLAALRQGVQLGEELKPVAREGLD